MQNYLCTQLFWVVKTHWLTLKKIPLFMRLFIIMFLFAVGVMRAADSYSQNVLLDIEVQNQTIEKVLGEIEKQSEFTFFYNVSIRPRACFSPSYNKVKSQTKHVWLLTLL